MKSPDPTLSVDRCKCPKNCKSLRIAILNPQITDANECFAVLPYDRIPDLIEFLSEHLQTSE